MPLDTSIYRGFQLPQIADPLEQQQRFLTLRGAMEQQAAQQRGAEREAAFRQEISGLGPAPSEEQLQAVSAKYGSAGDMLKTLTASRDRREATEARKVSDIARLEESVKMNDFMREIRLRQMTNDEDKRKEVERHNRESERLQRELTALRGTIAAAGRTTQVPVGYRATPDGNLEAIPGGPADVRNNKAPKPPKDYEWTDDTYTEVRPIKGGPKDTSEKDAARLEGAKQKADIVIGKVDEALKQTGFFSTGLTGSVLGKVPGTGAYDLGKTIDTIKAQVGFAELQAMREASPTGGALGQVAVQELTMLQSVIASLDKEQSEDQIRRNLGQVKQHFENWKAAVMQAQRGNNTPKPGAPTPAPAPAKDPSKMTNAELAARRRELMGGGK